MASANDWQQNKSLAQCMKYLFHQQVACDVQFQVGQSEDSTIISAHKTILLARSPVFYAMFCGDLTETSDVIQVPDVEPETFRLFLSYLYTDEVLLSETSAFDVMYSAKKYMVPQLVETCSNYLIETLSITNAPLIYEKAKFFDEKDLMTKCQEIIMNNSRAVVESDFFLTISNDTLCDILQLQQLDIPELELFEACRRWAQEQCRNLDKEVTPENEKRILGNALYHLHIPEIPLQEFADKVATSDLLSSEECLAVYKSKTCTSKPKENPYPVLNKRKPKTEGLSLLVKSEQIDAYNKTLCGIENIVESLVGAVHHQTQYHGQIGYVFGHPVYTDAAQLRTEINKVKNFFTELSKNKI